MPLIKRGIEPVNLSRTHVSPGVQNELECVTNSTLANVIRQLSSLSNYAEDLFSELSRDANTFFHRANQIQERVDKLKVKVTQLDSTGEEVSLQDIHMRKPFKSSTKKDQQIITIATRPTAISDIYSQCDAPPPLDKLNPYREDGKDSRKFYTDPTYFFELWCREMQKDTELTKKELHKRKKKLYHVHHQGQNIVNGGQARPNRDKQPIREARNRVKEMNMYRHGKEFVEPKPAQTANHDPRGHPSANHDPRGPANHSQLQAPRQAKDRSPSRPNSIEVTAHYQPPGEPPMPPGYDGYPQGPPPYTPESAYRAPQYQPPPAYNHSTSQPPQPSQYNAHNNNKYGGPEGPGTPPQPHTTPTRRPPGDDLTPGRPPAPGDSTPGSRASSAVSSPRPSVAPPAPPPGSLINSPLHPSRESLPPPPPPPQGHSSTPDSMDIPPPPPPLLADDAPTPPPTPPPPDASPAAPSPPPAAPPPAAPPPPPPLTAPRPPDPASAAGDDKLSIASNNSSNTVSSAGSGVKGYDAPARDTRCDLLAAIRTGINLRKVEERRQKESASKTPTSFIDVQSIMEAAFEVRRKALEANDESEDEEDDGDWSDDD